MDIAASSSTNSAVVGPPSVRSVDVSHQSPTGSPLVLPFRGLNGNSRAVRRYREIAVAIADDLGDPDKLSEPTKILVRQAASLTLQIEGLQTKIVRGDDVGAEQLVRLSNVLARTLQRLGLKKQAPAKRTSPLVEHFLRPLARSAVP